MHAYKYMYMYVNAVTSHRFKTLLKEWREQLCDIIGCIGKVEAPDREGTHDNNSQDTKGVVENEVKDTPQVEELMVKVEKWRSAFSYAIDSQDTQNTEQVYTHACMIIVSFLVYVIVLQES